MDIGQRQACEAGAANTLQARRWLASREGFALLILVEQVWATHSRPEVGKQVGKAAEGKKEGGRTALKSYNPNTEGGE